MLQWQKLIVFIIDKPLLNSFKTLPKTKILKTNYLFLQTSSLMRSIAVNRSIILVKLDKTWRYWCNLVACKTVDLSVRVQIPGIALFNLYKGFFKQTTAKQLARQKSSAFLSVPGIALLFNSKYSHQH